MTPETGDRVKLPAGLVARMAMAHLVDHQAGDSLVWKAEEIHKFEFQAHLVKDDVNTRVFGFEGDFWMEAIARGDLKVAGQMVGEFTLDKHTQQVRRFRAYFEGKEVGTVNKGGDIDDLTSANRPPSPLYIAMTETAPDDLIARSVAPVLRTTLKDYRSPKMDRAWQQRYGEIDQSSGETTSHLLTGGSSPAGAPPATAARAPVPAGDYTPAAAFDQAETGKVWTFGSLAPGDSPDPSSFTAYTRATNEFGGIFYFESQAGRDPHVSMNFGPITQSALLTIV